MGLAAGGIGYKSARSWFGLVPLPCLFNCLAGREGGFDAFVWCWQECAFWGFWDLLEGGVGLFPVASDYP